MKRTVILLCVLIVSSIGAASAEKGDHFWLLKGGMMWLDNTQKPDYLTTLGLTYGIGLTERISFELDYDRSIMGGAYSVATPESGEFKIWLATASAVYRHLLGAGVYLKAKAGYTYGKETRTSSIQADDNSRLHGLSGNLGLGYLAGPLMGTSTTFELSYTRHKQDISSVMLGVNLTF